MDPATVGCTTALPGLMRYFSQIGYVVSDIDAAVLDLSRSFGVSFKRARGSDDHSGVRYRGKPTNPALTLAFADLRGIELEIIQPLNKSNLYTDFLDTNGPGLHHIGFKIPDHEQFVSYYDLLIANGNVPLMEGEVRASGVEFCYFDCSAFGASVVELTHFF